MSYDWSDVTTDQRMKEKRKSEIGSKLVLCM